ncbi:hypothetical protein [Haloechinothrix salitolerans]|uniref:Uncharacterized protein n=1 Tax=Haloechinothrix salitolerans TaxID=926830 RepID=A0ABW2BVV6_9PSEU
MARPTAVLDALSDAVRAHLTCGAHTEPGSPDEVTLLVSTLRQAVEQLAEDERLYVEVDLNLVPEHGYATLTERQESLARRQKCAAKTVRRHADRALDTLAYLLVAADPAHPAPRHQRHPAEPGTPDGDSTAENANAFREFWRLADGSRVDIVCSEIPDDERPYYASPADRNYLRYAKFADLDSLIYLRTRFAQIAPTVTIRDFAPSEYYNTHADALVVVGGPPWNAKYREFLPQLPFYFEPHPLGEDDPLVVAALPGLMLGPRWTQRQELLEDLAVFTRLTLAQGTTVFLLGGCLTLGVLGAAHCFLEGQRGARSISYVGEQVGEDDFVLVTEARRIGGITDVSDLTMVNPLILLARRNNEPFTTVVDNTDRYTTMPTAR